MSIAREAIVAAISNYYKGCISSKRAIGAEFEKIAFREKEAVRVPYLGKQGIQSFLNDLVGDYGEAGEKENGNLIGLKTQHGVITLEPGAQFELGSNVFSNLHDMDKEWKEHIATIVEKGKNFGYRWLAIGMDPINTSDRIIPIPKKRYDIMADYLPKKGNLALSMMRLTAATQVNLDYISEQDAMEMLRCSLLASPFITSMFANSPIVEGKKSNYLSYRTKIWANTDPDRCGLISSLLEKENLTFADYAEVLIDLPLMFYYDKNGDSLKAYGKSMKDLVTKKEPTRKEIEQSIQQLFTEVRLKSFLEVRGIDCPPSHLNTTVPAIWTGLLYNEEKRSKVIELCSPLLHSENWQEIWDNLARNGLKTKIKDTDSAQVCYELVEIAKDGLEKRNICNAEGKDESIYLQPLDEMLHKKCTPADYILAKWSQNMDNLLEYVTYK